MKRCGGSERNLIEMKNDFGSFLDKVDKNEMADAETAAELLGLQAGEERRGSHASHTVDCCMETVVEQFFSMGADQARSKFDTMCQVFLKKLEENAPHAQMPGKGGRRNSEDRRTRARKSQQLALSASSGCNEGTPASSLELDLPRVRGALSECGGAGKSGTATDVRNRPLSNSPSRRPMEDDASFGGLVKGERLKELVAKKKKNRETARVRTQGLMMETAKVGTSVPPEANSLEEDPRTFKEPVERWRVQRKRKEKKWKKKDKKKKVKYRRSSLWNKAKERIASFLVANLKEGEKEKKGRKSEKTHQDETSLGQVGEDC